MTRKNSHDFADRVAGLCAECERVLLRILVFALFVYELGRFAKWLVQ